jgi:hypothetical protein
MTTTTTTTTTINNTTKIEIPVEINIKDGRGAYAASLQMILRHVADFHITVVDIISEKFNIPVDEIMNTITSDSRYNDMLVSPDIHRLSSIKDTDTKDTDTKDTDTKDKNDKKPKINKNPAVQKKIKIKSKSID